MRRRSRSLQPPHTPCSMRCSRACSRQSLFTGQLAQILRALSTPTPSLGKNVDGAYIRHSPSAIHPVVESGSGVRGRGLPVLALGVIWSPPGVDVVCALAVLV